MKRIKLIFRYLYLLNHHQGFKELTLYEYLYKYRTGFGTAFKMADGIINGF